MNDVITKSALDVVRPTTAKDRVVSSTTKDYVAATEATDRVVSAQRVDVVSAAGAENDIVAGSWGLTCADVDRLRPGHRKAERQAIQLVLRRRYQEPASRWPPPPKP